MILSVNIFHFSYIISESKLEQWLLVQFPPIICTISLWQNYNLIILVRGTAKSGSSDRRCCKTDPNGRIDLKLGMEGSFWRFILVLVKWRSHCLCGGQTNILQFWPHLSTRNIFTYPRHDFYEVSVSKNAITSELEAIDKKK